MSTSQSDASDLFGTKGDLVFKHEGGNKMGYRIRSFNNKESSYE